MQWLNLITNKIKPPDPVGIVTGQVNQLLGERPDISFKKLIDYYLDDPTIQNAVNSFRDQIVGSGFYVTASNNRAVKIVNEFCDGVDFDSIIYDIVGEMLTCGNSFVEMLEPMNLQTLAKTDIVTIKKLDRDKFGNVIAIVQEVDGIERKLDPKRFIHFKLFEVARKPFAIGLFHSLATPQVIEGEVRPSIIDSISKVRDDMVRVFDSYASPKDMYVFEGASEAFLGDQAVKIRNMKKSESFLTNKKFDHHEIKIDPRSRFDKYVEFLQVQYELGSQTPAAKLQTTTGYTEASARAVIELVERRIIGIQRKLKRIVEKEIFDRVLIREGLNVKHANLELHWGQPDVPEFDIKDVFSAVAHSIISKEEARDILRNSGWQLETSEEQFDNEELDQRMELAEEVTI